MVNESEVRGHCKAHHFSKLRGLFLHSEIICRFQRHLYRLCVCRQNQATTDGRGVDTI